MSNDDTANSTQSGKIEDAPQKPKQFMQGSNPFKNQAKGGNKGIKPNQGQKFTPPIFKKTPRGN